MKEPEIASEPLKAVEQIDEEANRDSLGASCQAQFPMVEQGRWGGRQ